MPKLSGNAGFRVQLESQGKTRNNHHLRSKTFELGRKLPLGNCSCIALLSYIPVTMHFLNTIHTMDIND